MKTLCPLLLVIFISLGLSAREIKLRLWVSGGMHGVVMGNRECPGWLSVSRQLQLNDPNACWIQLGANQNEKCLSQLTGFKNPDVILPTEEDFRLMGRGALEARSANLSVLNVSNLPQFPEYSPSFPEVQIWKQEDGIEVFAFGLLSDEAPLRIPADKLRPLKITPALQSIRGYLTENPLADQAFSVLALPEGSNGKDWSEWLPEIPILIMPVGAHPKIIEVHQGRQLRIQPSLYGRALIRVDVYWDTVARSFSPPKAEVVWVKSPHLQGLDLPECLLDRIRPLDNFETPDLIQELLKHGDAVLLPKFKKLSIASNLPDAIRISAVPQDHAWLRVRADRKTWERWQAGSDLSSFENPNASNAEMTILISAETAAGNGKWNSVIRQDLQTGYFQSEWMRFRSRDLILPVKRADL